MYENIFLVAPITALGVHIEIPLPTGISPAMIINSSVTVLTLNGEIYPAGPNKFTWVISNKKLKVSVPFTAPASFVGSNIRWLLNWQSPVQVWE